MQLIGKTPIDRGLAFIRRIDPTKCPRCGNAVARDYRYCSVCGAFLPGADPASVQTRSPRGTEIRIAKAPGTALREVERDEHRLAPNHNRPAPLRSRRLSNTTFTIRTTLAICIAVSAVTGAFTYLLCTTRIANRLAFEVPPAPVAHESIDNAPMASDGYLTAKTLHEIDASIATSGRNGDATLTTSTVVQTSDTTDGRDDTARNGMSNENLRAHRSASAVSEAGNIASQATYSTNVDSGEQLVEPHPSIFSDTTNPDALERAILEHGWNN
ncbi:zinc ribbon domain-containing protein [Paraburkholderia sp. LEh10]|uniref:zinc ribbon domain-containing protein n=1 Tax=Paraburkholderia sp. LEh10 TaxID=2821353 RepID=UPI001AEBA423|nr:zinc ribbon domain-containing protein [Paraburkholderia sp. LEh10]MBP0590961.1 zinc ribbon domain-containing protein [Paraburkholderia sp. LEh10]